MKTNKIIDVKTFETYFYDTEDKIREFLQKNTSKKNFKIENIFTIPMQVNKRTEQMFPDSIKETIQKVMFVILYSYEI